MSKITMSLDRRGLLDYARLGKEAIKNVRGAMKVVVNEGRKTARHLLGSQFRRRSGKLAKQTRAIRTGVTARAAEVSGSVGPMPNLTNIFEKGATVPARTIAPKRGSVLRFFNASGEAVFVRGRMPVKGFVLAARPVQQPALKQMVTVGTKQFDQLLEGIARS